MTAMTQLTATTSRLSQSGKDCQPFRLDSLSIMEIEGFTAMRIRALPGVSPNNLTDMDLPPEAGMCRGHNPVRLCLRPGEWLELGAPGTAGKQHLFELHKDKRLHTWIETDGLALLRIEGDAAPWLLRKNSSLDFLVNPDTPSHCAQCKFGRIRVLVFYRQRESGSGEFDLVVDRSLASYLWTLLISTAPHAEELHKKFGRGY